MNRVHPIFAPIVESLARQHFVSALDRVIGILDTPAPTHGAGFTTGCCDCGAPLEHDDLRCDRHAEEIQAERLENGRWDDRFCGDGASEDLQTARGER